MNAPDPIIEAYVAGLDLVALHSSVTASTAAIGLSPLAGVAQCQSVILHCKRHRNIDRLAAVIRSEFESVPMPVALSQLVSAVLNFAGTLSVTILTETEVSIAAAETMAKMETELSHLQGGDGLSAINRSVQRDITAVHPESASWYWAILTWLDRFGRFIACGGKERWGDRLAILLRTGMAKLIAASAIIGPQLAEIIDRFSDFISKWARVGLQAMNGLLHQSGTLSSRRTAPNRRPDRWR
jgi:hypothetical protein